MDKQEAREILQLFRPGTEDAQDPQIAEALLWVQRDEELARWFENHCSVYAAMRRKLQQIPVPEGLQQEILRADAVRRGRIVNLRNMALPLAAAAAMVVLAVVLLGLTELFFDLKHLVLWSGVAFLGFLQVTAALLNLLPIPGLDGYNALEPHLSPETQRALEQFKPYGFVILFFLIMARPVNNAFFGFIGWLFDLAGVPTMPVSVGMQLIQIWHAF